MLNPQSKHLPSAQPVSGAMNVIAGLFSQRTGQDVMASRAWRIDSVLQPLLRERDFADLDELVAALASDGSGRLASAVTDALLNQETSFYRDAGVIELAADVVAARREDDPMRRVRIWSAGCSAGQEPYSLAMLLADRAETDDKTFPDIVATDVSEAAIARARAGRYTHFEIQRGLPIRRMLAWFEQDGETFVARSELVRRVSFRRHNLVAEPAPYGQFDVILCRNVLLYFSAAVRRGVFDRLADALRPGGLLILGAGETTIGQTERFVPSQRFRGAYDVASAAARDARRA
ncbi:MAG: protein-glutamate O-methyltransferase CheR [Pseudomonadota bacterium]